MSLRRQEISLDEREIIIKFRDEGLSVREIGKKLKRSPASVQTVIQNFNLTKSLTSKPRSGRPQKLSDRDKRNLLLKIKCDPKKTAKDLAKHIASAKGINVHPITVRRMLRQHEFFNRVARRKPLISSKNEKKRLEFANLHKGKDLNYWDRVLFTDESKFNLFGNDRNYKVWRKKNESLKKKNIVATVKHGGGCVMVWGSMSAAGVGNLVFIDKTMDRFVYLDILRNNLEPSVQKSGLKNDWIFQQDNDPKHTAKTVKEWLLYNAPRQLHTPPQSPDLNPIEHLWSEIKRNIGKYNIQNKNDLKNAIVSEWNKVAPDTTKNLVHSMPRRLIAVIKAKGGATKY